MRPTRRPDPPPDPPACSAPPALAALQQALLAWFDQAGRDLPWRHTRNPYHILVAEMMLQQTQVDRVMPRYAAFLATFPTLESLAAAPTAAVIQQWAGLGYNRRAVNLQRTARAICTEHGGTFPRDVAALQRLPGIGPYTAGAIACFAFEQDVAFVDTNIRRVLQRLLASETRSSDPAAGSRDRTSGDRALLRLAQAIIPTGQGWAWNQALMELGALVCTPTPACWRCPLRAHCPTYATWRQADEHHFDAPPAEDQAATPAAGGGPAPAAPARRRVAERAAPFVGSNRYYRGRAIAALRSLPAGERLPLDRLGPLVKADFDAAVDGAWLRDLVAGLARDGLAELANEGASLPTG